MGPVVPIDSPDDPRLAEYVGLTDVDRRLRVEAETGVFIGEGELVVRRALRHGYPLRSVLLAGARLEAVEAAVAGTTAPVYVAAPAVVEAVTGFHVHRGCLAAFDRLPLPSPAALLGGCTRVLVLENVTNPTNVGAVFRSAAGLGMDGVLLDPTTADPLYRRSVRVSMGEVFALPYARVEPWPRGLGVLREAGFRVLALTPDPGATPLGTLDLAAEPRVALLLGAEGPGLSAPALAVADQPVRIPMHRGVDSLNVAAAAAVACWEVARR